MVRKGFLYQAYFIKDAPSVSPIPMQPFASSTTTLSMPLMSRDEVDIFEGRLASLFDIPSTSPTSTAEAEPLALANSLLEIFESSPSSSSKPFVPSVDLDTCLQLLTSFSRIPFEALQRPIIRNGFLQCCNIAEQSAMSVSSHLSQAAATGDDEDEGEGRNDDSCCISSTSYRLFGRQMSIHQMMGGAADVILWKRQHVSCGIVVVATIAWILFEQSGLSFLLICSDVLLILVVLLFLRANYAVFRKKHLRTLPELVLSEEMVINAAASFRVKINYVLLLAHDITLGRDFRLFFKRERENSRIYSVFNVTVQRWLGGVYLVLGLHNTKGSVKCEPQCDSSKMGGVYLVLGLHNAKGSVKCEPQCYSIDEKWKGHLIQNPNQDIPYFSLTPWNASEIGLSNDPEMEQEVPLKH
ncbi:hypothetical protein TEA_012121 [Camellia sinensis var. sinensis]|uniref:Reticulon-like protein n=1 Tax=Camellia sinensis var. sinensis TaxID=542762 RepID=A0A4V6RXZ4_CAMSN|nr:hypothetical protein TEA_012121 [Camellia sinensis var. sinensis]